MSRRRPLGPRVRKDDDVFPVSVFVRVFVFVRVSVRIPLPVSVSVPVPVPPPSFPRWRGSSRMQPPRAGDPL